MITWSGTTRTCRRAAICVGSSRFTRCGCRCIRDAIAAVQDNVASLEKQASDLLADQRNLEAKLKKKQQELERGEKRLQSLQTVRCARLCVCLCVCGCGVCVDVILPRRPAFMDEYEKLEGELAEEYEIYLEKFRNLDFLEHELDLHSKVGEACRLQVASRLLHGCFCVNSARRRSWKLLTARSSVCKRNCAMKSFACTWATKTWTMTRMSVVSPLMARRRQGKFWWCMYRLASR